MKFGEHLFVILVIRDKLAQYQQRISINLDTVLTSCSHLPVVLVGFEPQKENYRAYKNNQCCLQPNTRTYVQ